MPTLEEFLSQGWKLHQTGDLVRAEQMYRQVLLVDGGNANAWCFLGMACHDQGRHPEAVIAYQQALTFQPHFPVALSNLGNTYKAMGRLDEAVASCQEALRQKPTYHTAYNNLGVALVALGRLEEASNSFESAIRFAPQDAVAHTNLSAALVRQGRYDEAQQNSERAIRLNPSYAEAHKNQGIVSLLLGNFEAGWDEYEWRWRCPGTSMPVFPQPLWDGNSLAGRTILLHAEQGLGDTIHFLRYAQVLHQSGARVILQAQKPLLNLLRNSPDLEVLLEQNASPPPFDVHAPLMSLPRIMRTRLDTIPANVPYLQADESLVELWRNELAAVPGFKVGISWQGSPSNHGDKQRSVSLSEFLPLAEIPGVQLISLQKGLGSEQLTQMRDRINVLDFGDRLDAHGAFVDTAAIMKSLDLVIAVDTAIAHLAGALGVPVWIALSYSPDWRWLLHRSDSPWYPSAQLFRQSSLGDWQTVFQGIARALSAVVSGVPTLPVITTPQLAVKHEPPRIPALAVHVSPGEFVDKLLELEVEIVRVTKPERQVALRRKIDSLRSVWSESVPHSIPLQELVGQLKSTQERIWSLNDQIRECERQQNFGERFVELARTAYREDERRRGLRQQIDELLGFNTSE